MRKGMLLNSLVGNRHDRSKGPISDALRTHFAASVKLTLRAQTVTAADASFRRHLQRNAAQVALASAADCRIYVR